MLYDCHAHLDLIDENTLERVLSEAKEKRIKKIVSCSTSFESNKKNLLLSKNFLEIESALGIYPLNLIELNDEEISRALNFFEENITHAIAVGEVGLDYKYSKKESEQEKQKKVLKKFVELANKYNKPLIIHSRFAQRDVLNLLKENNAKKVLLHSFVDSKKLIKKAVELGYFISCGLSVLDNELIQKNVVEIPLEKLLFETDSPIRFSGEIAYPKKIELILNKIAELKKIESSELELIQEKNYKKLFY